MRSYDLSPLFRSTVGFDRLGHLFDAAMASSEPSYPPYNIEKQGDNAYRITMAVAGFEAAEIDLSWRPNELTVSAQRTTKEEGQFLHRGIAARNFQHKFSLADHIEVGQAGLENGLLTIDLVREVPEALKPRKITIETGTPQTIEARKAA